MRNTPISIGEEYCAHVTRAPACHAQQGYLLLGDTCPDFMRTLFVKPKERQEARRLRSEGRSIKEIVRLVGVSVSPASVWTGDVELTPEHEQEHFRRHQEYCGIDHPRWLDCLPAAECAPRGLNSDLPL